jgi:predicted Ser/Thr protein kinase
MENNSGDIIGQVLREQGGFFICPERRTHILDFDRGQKKRNPKSLSS